MPVPSKRPVRLALLLTACVAPLIAGTTQARADDVGPLPPAPVLSVTLDANSPFVIPGPNPRPAGPVTFQVTSADGAEHWFSPIAFRDGTTPAQWVQELEASFSPDPSVALPALQAVYRDANFAGGLSVIPERGSWFTEDLAPGTYYISDSPPDSEQSTTPPREAVLQVADPSQAARMPRVDAVLSVREDGPKASFVAPCTLPADGTFLIRNPRRSSQPYEFLFRQVAPGTTDADLAAYFGALRQGLTPSENPFVSDEQQGLLPISPGDAAVFHADFTPGRYAMLTYVRDPQTGLPRVWEGTFKIVTFY
jgi:hypothetical protein